MSNTKDLTRAYLAIEGMLKTLEVSEATRSQLQLTLVSIDKDIAAAVKRELGRGDHGPALANDSQRQQDSPKSGDAK